jgi:hypothetical protein
MCASHSELVEESAQIFRQAKYNNTQTPEMNNNYKSFNISKTFLFKFSIARGIFQASLFLFST